MTVGWPSGHNPNTGRRNSQQTRYRVLIIERCPDSSEKGRNQHEMKKHKWKRDSFISNDKWIPFYFEQHTKL